MGTFPVGSLYEKEYTRELGHAFVAVISAGVACPAVGSDSDSRRCANSSRVAS
jgi:hypothetical protein